ncbi:RluA family pseudouridine synthase [Patescibacteria group bacterium]|nr:RluA family pseudouridine synthase [Patescibacteria group bacterium]
MDEIKIIFQDKDIIILDKPSGIIVNRSDTTKNLVTVQDWMETQFGIQNSEISINKESDFYKRSGIVHRLDKETSGILIAAKNEEAFLNMQNQFKERIVKKTYITLAHGKILPREGEIKASVGRLPWNRMRFGIVAGGKDSITKYKVLEYFEKQTKRGNFLSLLEAYPETGRTHQIRVHLQYIGHPIFSDFLYAGRKTSRQDRKLLERVFLHASRISFDHPKTGKKMSFESELPSQLSSVLKNL